MRFRTLSDQVIAASIGARIQALRLKKNISLEIVADTPASAARRCACCSISPLLTTDGDSPLDKGRARPLIIIAPSTVDPTWVSLKKSLDEPANRKGFTDRYMVLYTELNLMGQHEGIDLGPQDTAALIRSLKLGAGAKTKVILVGKDGEKKLEQVDTVKLEEIFAAVDHLPAAEKETSPPTVATPVADTEPAAKTAG
ncbi:hypothetical protein J2X66_002856 [Pseudomonas sp. 3296]|uniref:DUF4174 domain-containing protein n=1 Tax=Pseudomonas sp. 3296 TaxID=2817753 RepID=UPI00285E5342|nr:DUF4174 domain-containing protein [Pseudomonas sp. 3296]MDR6915987.1 hypothetical protein [Pseudomonas sp. 3296]